MIDRESAREMLAAKLEEGARKQAEEEAAAAAAERAEKDAKTAEKEAAAAAKKKEAADKAAAKKKQEEGSIVHDVVSSGAFKDFMRTAAREVARGMFGTGAALAVGSLPPRGGERGRPGRPGPAPDMANGRRPPVVADRRGGRGEGLKGLKGDLSAGRGIRRSSGRRRPGGRPGRDAAQVGARAHQGGQALGVLGLQGRTLGTTVVELGALGDLVLGHAARVSLDR